VLLVKSCVFWFVILQCAAQQTVELPLAMVNNTLQYFS